MQAEFGIEDSEGIARLEQASNARQRAEQEVQSRRTKIVEAQEATREGRLLDEQAQMRKRLGVTLEDADEGEEGEQGETDGVEPAELKMYQEMWKNGLARPAYFTLYERASKQAVMARL